VIVVRYATLVALVIWLGAMVDERFGDVFHYRPHFIAYACGAATVVGLVMLKFIGPPPIAFPLRAGIAALMVALAGATAFVSHDASQLLMTVNIGLGLVLLIWYVRE
jgi:hypothetical protein